MTPEFKAFYLYLSPAEGGKVDHELDRGGYTAWGISSKWANERGIDMPETPERAKELMFIYFWGEGGCQEMSAIAAWCYCDALVNHTTEASTRMLQAGLGIKSDGRPGPVTRAAAASVPSNVEFITRYIMRRQRYYVDIVKNDFGQIAFALGWSIRLHKMNMAMIREGIFAEDIMRLPWYRKKPARVAGAGVGVFGLLLAIMFPDLDTTSWQTIATDLTAASAGTGGILATILAALNIKSK